VRHDRKLRHDAGSHAHVVLSSWGADSDEGAGSWRFGSGVTAYSASRALAVGGKAATNKQTRRNPNKYCMTTSPVVAQRAPKRGYVRTSGMPSEGLLLPGNPMR
jgi:hypothetical protein